MYSCEIVFDNGTLKCSGELMKDGFCIYGSRLPMSPDEIAHLREMLEERNQLENSVQIRIE